MKNKKIKKSVDVLCPSGEMDAYLSRRIIWRAGRVACRAGAERSASFAVSSVSLPQNPAALTCPNARSALTELLACLREGGGRRGRG